MFVPALLLRPLSRVRFFSSITRRGIPSREREDASRLCFLQKCQRSIAHELTESAYRKLSKRIENDRLGVVASAAYLDTDG